MNKSIFNEREQLDHYKDNSTVILDGRVAQCILPLQLI